MEGMKGWRVGLLGMQGGAEAAGRVEGHTVRLGFGLLGAEVWGMGFRQGFGMLRVAWQWWHYNVPGSLPNTYKQTHAGCLLLSLLSKSIPPSHPTRTPTTCTQGHHLRGS
jgi:hypothetical protein